MRVEYRKRELTAYVYVVCSGSDVGTFTEAFRKARVQGYYDTGYHYYIDPLGEVFEDRDLDAIADSTFEEYTHSIYILCESEKKINDCQRLSLEELLPILCNRYGSNLEVIFKCHTQ